jgi:hypothetical protein
MHLRNPWPLMVYCCRNETAEAALCTLRFSDSDDSTHHAHTLWDPTLYMILTTVPCDRLKLCCSSLTVILLFLGTAFSTHLLVSCACCCCSAASLAIVCIDFLSSKVCTAFCHSLMTHHIVPVNLDQPMKSSAVHSLH